MIEFNKYSGVSPNNEDVSLTIASGPVIIQDGKVLVVKHGDDTGWKFPGGKVRDDASPRETAQREAKEELDIVVALEGDPYVVAFTREKNGTQEYVRKKLERSRSKFLSNGASSWILYSCASFFARIELPHYIKHKNHRQL